MNKLYFFVLLVIPISLWATEQKSAMINSQTVYKELSIPSTKLAEKYNLHSMGPVVAMPGGDIKSVGLMFQRRGELSKQEARVLLISMIQDLISELKLLENLGKHHFGIENTEITIYIAGFNSERLHDPNLAVIGLELGKLRFVTTVTVDGYPQNKSRVVETYEEALKEIGGESSKCET